MKKNPNNIAILSSSPLMMMLGIKLQKDGHRVKVFDFSKNIGGAWTWYQKIIIIMKDTKVYKYY